MNHLERSTLPGVTLCGAVIAEREELPRAYQVTRDAIVGRYDAGNLCGGRFCNACFQRCPRPDCIRVTIVPASAGEERGE